jgi:hypothetical protein
LRSASKSGIGAHPATSAADAGHAGNPKTTALTNLEPYVDFSTMAKDVRLTTQTISVLRAVMTHRASGASGAVIAKETGLASGSLYPILKRLEDAGWLSSEWEKGDPSELGRPRRRF